MPKRSNLLLTVSALLLAPALHAQIWIRIADFDTLPTTATEEDLQDYGWIFHDYDFATYLICDTGELDCSGVREIVPAPFAEGRGNAIAIRGSDPDEEGPANTRSASAFPLPHPIAVGDVATVYMRFALEGRQISAHFGLMADDGSVNDLDANPARLDYDDLAVTSQVSYSSSNHLRVFVDGWRDATLNEMQIIETEKWYEVWWQIYNMPDSAGGGYFDIFIRSDWYGAFPQVTHLGNPYDEQAPHYPFRNQPDAALDRFLVIMNPGVPSAGPLRQDAVYFDDLYMIPGMLCEGDDCVTYPPNSLWAHLLRMDGTWKHAGIGHVYDVSYPWIYHGGANSWMYVGYGSSLDSIYLYDNTAAAWVWTAENLGGWYYDFTASAWLAW